MNIAKNLLKAGAAAGAVHIGAKSLGRKLDDATSEYQLEELTHPMPGTEAFVVRDDGTKLRTVTSGSGPTVVMVHGAGLAVASFNLVAERLIRNGCRVIGYDQRGHGQSTIGADGLGSAELAADLAAVLDHYDVGDGVLVGHSMGGFVAIRALLDGVLGDRIKHLVLIASHAGEVATGAPTNKTQMSLIRAGVLAPIMKSTTYGRLAAATVFGRRSGVAAEALRRMMDDADLTSLAGVFEMQFDESYYPRLNELTLPVTVISGTDDRTVPAVHAERLVEGIEGADLIWLDGIGHMVLWEEPDAVVTAILAAQSDQTA